MTRQGSMVLLAVMVLLAAVMVSSAPPVTKKIVKATDAGKMHDIKLSTTSKASSQKLQEGKQALDEEAPAEDEEAAAEDEAAAEEAPAEDAAADDEEAGDDDDADADDEPDGVADDDEQAAKMGFWKKIIGGNPGGMGMGNGDHHPSKDIPALVWALPIVGFVGVGIAIAAYCSFGT